MEDGVNIEHVQLYSCLVSLAIYKHFSQTSSYNLSLKSRSRGISQFVRMKRICLKHTLSEFNFSAKGNESLSETQVFSSLLSLQSNAGNLTYFKL